MTDALETYISAQNVDAIIKDLVINLMVGLWGGGVDESTQHM